MLAQRLTFRRTQYFSWAPAERLTDDVVVKVAKLSLLLDFLYLLLLLLLLHHLSVEAALFCALAAAHAFRAFELAQVIESVHDLVGCGTTADGAWRWSGQEHATRALGSRSGRVVARIV